MAEPVDIEVGKHIRVLRHKLGLTQQQLASQVGVTFQQLQKYEKGSNRVSASRLTDIAKVLGVEVSYFFNQHQESVAASDSKLAQLIGVYNNLPRKKQLLLLAMAKEL